MMSQLRGIPQMFPKLSENIWRKFGGSGVGTHDPMVHMINHWGMIHRSNAYGRRRINNNSLNILTNSQGGTILLIKVTKLQRPKKIANETYRVRIVKFSEG